MRISDWSSDVCSSDLCAARPAGPADRLLAAVLALRMERRAGGNLAGRLGALAVARVGVGRDARRGLRLQRHRRSRSRRAGGAHATAARGVGPGVGEKGMGVAYYARSEEDTYERQAPMSTT